MVCVCRSSSTRLLLVDLLGANYLVDHQMSLNNQATSCSNRNHYGSRWYCQYSSNSGGSGSSSSSNNTYCSYISINSRIILVIYCIINLSTTKDIAQQRLGCNLSDHRACDELCKQDSYWYGYCSTWDGRDFTCSCYHYKLPLDGSLCKRMQEICKEYCLKMGLEGGYCYVYASRTAPNGTTQCKCFEELLQPA